MDHAEILGALLPPVSYAPNSEVLAAELASAAALLDEALALVVELQRELDPRTTYSLLEDWETAYGLPDLCLDTASPVVEERRLAVLQQMRARGSQTPAYYESLAHALGYEGARVIEYTPWTCVDTCVEPIAGADWRHVWAIQAPQAERITYFTCMSPCVEPLANWSALEALSCVLNRLKPVQTLCYIDLGA